MNRITQKDLERELAKINPPGAKWNTVGAYYLDYAYGGVKLVQIVNEGGGIREISEDGFGTKRQLYAFMHGMNVQRTSA